MRWPTTQAQQFPRRWTPSGALRQQPSGAVRSIRFAMPSFCCVPGVLPLFPSILLSSFSRSVWLCRTCLCCDAAILSGADEVDSGSAGSEQGGDERRCESGLVEGRCDVPACLPCGVGCWLLSVSACGGACSALRRLGLWVEYAT
eukprot:3860517-Rhodomonas_salina.2